VDPIGHEAVAKREHLHDRAKPDGVAEVVRVDAACESRACSRLRGDETGMRVLTFQLVADVVIEKRRAGTDPTLAYP